MCSVLFTDSKVQDKINLKFNPCCVYSFSSLCLFAVLFHNALPFVGFGFLDNAIMIAAVSEFIYTVPGRFIHYTSHFLLSACSSRDNTESG